MSKINMNKLRATGGKLLLLTVLGFTFLTCSNNSVTTEEQGNESLSPEMVEAMNPQKIMDPMGSIPDLSKIDIEKYKVFNDAESLSRMKTSTTGYEVNEIGQLNTTYPISTGTAINNSGHATGYAYTGSGTHAFLSENGVMQDLGVLPNATYNHSIATDINVHNQVVGYSYTGYYTHAFMWDDDNGMQDLGTLSGGMYSYASGINDQGQVVGYAHTNSGNVMFIWDTQNGMQDIGKPSGSTQMIPTAINNNGVVVGYAQFSNGYHAVIWDEQNGFTDLESLGTTPLNNYYQIYPRDINDAGQIIGDAYNISSHQNGAFLWDPVTGFQSLNELNSNSHFYALGLNNNGQVAGYMYDYGSYYYSNIPVLWDEQNGVQNLGHLNQTSSYYYRHSIAYDVNDNGEVIGYSLDENGRNKAVIWNGQPINSNTPPIANAGIDQVIEATGILTSATLDGSASSDADGDALTYSWSLNGTEIATGVSSVVNLELGENTITLTVDDGNGETSSDDVVIEIVDTTPPELTYTVEKTSLWPANHKMNLSVSGINASDIYDANPETSVAVSSNEDTNGKGDGNSAVDWEVNQNTDGSYDVHLRAERSGKGSGRLYTVTITSIDSSGNIAEETVEVTVAKSQGKSAR